MMAAEIEPTSARAVLCLHQENRAAARVLTEHLRGLEASARELRYLVRQIYVTPEPLPEDGRETLRDWFAGRMRAERAAGAALEDAFDERKERKTL